MRGGDRLHKYVVSMMSISGNMEMHMSGSILQIFLTIFLSLPQCLGRSSVYMVASHHP